MITHQIISAQDSPRLDENGTLCWYEGDAFQITWTSTLNEELGLGDTKEDHNYFDPTDHLLFQFFSEDNTSKPVAKFDFTNIEDNTVLLNFTPAISKKMPAGNYTYCIKKITYAEDGSVDSITTIGAKGRVKVEECH